MGCRAERRGGVLGVGTYIHAIMLDDRARIWNNESANGQDRHKASTDSQAQGAKRMRAARRKVVEAWGLFSVMCDECDTVTVLFADEAKGEAQTPCDGCGRLMQLHRKGTPMQPQSENGVKTGRHGPTRTSSSA